MTCVDHIGHGIQQFSPEFRLTMVNRVIDKGIIAPELIRHLDIQRQQQQQPSLLGYR
jgi:transposase-like protein